MDNYKYALEMRLLTGQISKENFQPIFKNSSAVYFGPFKVKRGREYFLWVTTETCDMGISRI